MYLHIRKLDDIPARVEKEEGIEIIISPELIAHPLPENFKDKLLKFVLGSNILGLNFDDSFKEVEPHYALHNDWLKFIPELIKSSKNLISLDLSGIKFTEEQLEAIYESLKGKKLSSLSLCRCDIDHEKAEILAEILAISPELKILSLSKNKLEDQGIAHIAPFINNMSQLSSLYLPSNNITAEGAVHLATALEGKKNLSIVSLSWNPLGDKGAASIAISLQNATELECLYLAKTGITASGAQALTGSLQDKTKIESLSIEMNNLGDNGAIAISSALQNSNNLKSVTLSHNNLTQKGAEKTLELFATHQNLRKVELYEETTVDNHKKVMGTNGLYIRKLEKFANVVLSRAKNNLYADPNELNSLKLNLLLALLTHSDANLLNKLEKISQSPEKYQTFIDACAEPLKGNFEQIKHQSFINHVLQVVWKFFASIFFEVKDKGNDHRKGYAHIVSKDVEDKGFVAKIEAEKSKLPAEMMRG